MATKTEKSDDGTSAAIISSYTAKDLSVLEGLDVVRKRPGMYIGTTDSRGLMHCLWEIIAAEVPSSDFALLVATGEKIIGACTTHG